LVEQPFVKNPEVKVGQLVKDAGAEVTSFIRLEVGEGIEVAEVDFAAEVTSWIHQPMGWFHRWYGWLGIYLI